MHILSQVPIRQVRVQNTCFISHLLATRLGNLPLSVKRLRLPNAVQYLSRLYTSSFFATTFIMFNPPPAPPTPVKSAEENGPIVVGHPSQEDADAGVRAQTLSTVLRDYFLQDELVGYSKNANLRLAGNKPTAQHNKIIVKELRVADAKDASERKQQLNEHLSQWLELVKNFDHHNVCRPVAISELHESAAYIVLPYYPEGNLLSWLGRYSDATDEVKIEMAKGILSGLAYIHGKGVIHGAIHDSNILVDSKGVPILSDVNLEVSMAGLPWYSEMTRWLPWERLIGDDIEEREDDSIRSSIMHTRPASEAADVYASALVICQLWTLQVPFPKCRLGCQVVVHLDRIRSIGIVKPGAVPDMVWKVIKDGLCVNPAERPMAEQLLAGLRTL